MLNKGTAFSEKERDEFNLYGLLPPHVSTFEEQIKIGLDKMTRMDDFDIDFQVAPIRNIVPQPQIVSLYVTAYVIEKLINHKDVVDIYGSDEEIYFTINQQVKKFLPL